MNNEALSDRNESDRSWLAERLLPGGEEPDPRFTLANERTYLAWIRTALALLAAGVALDTLSIPFMGNELQKIVAMALVVLAMVISSSACVRWLKIERALRAQNALPFPMLVPAISLVLLILIVVLVLRSVFA